MTLFFKVHYVLIGFVIAVVLLTVATMYPYLKRRLPEIAAENQSYASARRRARHSFDESGAGKNGARDLPMMMVETMFVSHSSHYAHIVNAWLQILKRICNPMLPSPDFLQAGPRV